MVWSGVVQAYSTSPRSTEGEWTHLGVCVKLTHTDSIAHKRETARHRQGVTVIRLRSYLDYLDNKMWAVCHTHLCCCYRCFHHPHHVVLFF